MASLAILSEVGQSINHHLPQLKCSINDSFLGQNFLRISSKLFDQNLVFTSAVEIIVTLQNSEELNFTLVSYKMEVLEETTFQYSDQDPETGLHTYILYLQKVMCDTGLVLCQGNAEENIFSNYGKIRKSDLILCLIEKSPLNSDQLVFRARQCRTVYPSGEVYMDTNLCRECTDFFGVFLGGEKDATEEDAAEGHKICPFSNCGKTFRRNKPWENHLKSHGKNDNPYLHFEKEQPNERNKVTIAPSVHSDLLSEVKCEPDIISGVNEVSPRKKVKLDTSLEKVKRYQCNICNNSYLYEKAFHNHMKTHETSLQSITESDFDCESCNQQFQNETNLNEHMTKEHMNNIHCDSCPMKFTFRKLLEDHNTEFHPKFHCVPCDINFQGPTSLHDHNLKLHEIISGDPCHICGKHVKRSSMANHVKMVHQGEDMRKHLCNICGNAYKTKTDLDRHYTKHTGERLHICQTCGKGHRWKDEMYKCENTHAGIFKFPCPHALCTKKFQTRFRLDLHLRTHDGRRPFQCPGCGYTCARKDNLSNHVKKVHKMGLEEAKQSYKKDYNVKGSTEGSILNKDTKEK